MWLTNGTPFVNTLSKVYAQSTTKVLIALIKSMKKRGLLDLSEDELRDKLRSYSSKTRSKYMYAYRIYHQIKNGYPPKV